MYMVEGRRAAKKSGVQNREESLMSTTRIQEGLGIRCAGPGVGTNRTVKTWGSVRRTGICVHSVGDFTVSFTGCPCLRCGGGKSGNYAEKIPIIWTDCRCVTPVCFCI